MGIARYIGDAAGPAIAAEVVRRIRGRFEIQSETPGLIGQARSELGAETRGFPVPPHVIFFRYRDTEIQVIRVLHERQDVETLQPE